MSKYCTLIRKLVHNLPLWSSPESKVANLKKTSTFTILSLYLSISQPFRVRWAPSSNQQLVESKWDPTCVCCTLWNRMSQFGGRLVANLVCVMMLAVVGVSGVCGLVERPGCDICFWCIGRLGVDGYIYIYILKLSSNWSRTVLLNVKLCITFKLCNI